MKRILLVSLIFSLATLVMGQSEPVKFGKISMEEMTMKSYDKDPSAPAVVLCDYGKTYFEYNDAVGLIQRYEVIRRVKIFNKSAYDEANVELPYYVGNSRRSLETINDIKAYSYNLAGNKIVETKMESSAIFDDKQNKYYHIKKFAIPNVKEGSVIEYRYTITSEMIGNIRDWYFQSGIPTMHSEYRLRVPDFFVFKKNTQGYTEFSVADTETAPDNFIINGEAYPYNLQKYRFVQKDVPAMKPEPIMGAVRSFASRIVFDLQSINFKYSMINSFNVQWETLCKELMKDDDFGGFFKHDKALTATVQPLIADKTDDKAKALAIYNYVANNFKAVNKGYYPYFYISQSFNDMLSTKVGRPQDVNAMLLAMLHAAGIEAQPVLVSSRSKGLVNQYYATLSSFDMLVAHVKIGEDDIYIDANDPLRPMGVLPYELLNDEGLMIDDAEGHNHFVMVINGSKSVNYVNATLNITSEGAIEGNYNVSLKGVAAFNQRQSVKTMGEEKTIQAYFKGLLEDGTFNKGTFENPLVNNASLKGDFNITTNNYVDKSGDKIYLSPLLMFGEENNPFKAETRLYPVNFGHASDVIFQCTYQIPSGYKIEEMPKMMRMQLPDGGMKFDYLIENTDTTIKITYKFVNSKAFYKAEDYVKLQFFFTEMLAKRSEQIVISKL